MDLVEMSKSELERYTVMRKLEACLINQQQAAMALNLSVRQIRRLWKHYQSFGALGLISRQRGRPSNRAIAAERVIPPKTIGTKSKTSYAALASSCLGGTPPMAMLGRS